MIDQSHVAFEFLSTAVLLLDRDLCVLYVNPAAESLFELNLKNCLGHGLAEVLSGTYSLLVTARHALEQQLGFMEHELIVSGHLGRPALHLNCTVTPIELNDAALLLECRPLNQQLKIAREERLLHEQQLNRELLRSLAHEIRNPLGGIRGAAQLLEVELDRRELREYTQVIVKEADRLQTLLDRLLTPQRQLNLGPVNIHEVLERVRSLILAEYPNGVFVARDYDLSLPELAGDREQLIQATLNVVRNAAQAMKGIGKIVLRTRVARQITIAKKRYQLGICIQIVDDGPGIEPDLADRIFYPLVTGREDGSGLGLTIAQSFIHQHQGLIEFESEPGRTCFAVLLPLRSIDNSTPSQGNPTP
jgi:two-component system, NtrC family, nitrogen regulation sensor histidine kinase GlnL